MNNKPEPWGPPRPLHQVPAFIVGVTLIVLCLVFGGGSTPFLIGCGLISGVALRRILYKEPKP
jgi:hypothetical protein